MRRPPPPPPLHHSPSPHHPPPPPQSPPYWDPPPPFMDEYYPLNYGSQYHHTPPYETGRSYDTSHKMEGYKAALYDGDTRNHHPPPPPSYKSRDSYVPHRYERDEYHYPPPPPPRSRSDHPQPPHLREEYHNSPPPHPPFTRDGFPPPLPPDRRNGYQPPPPPPPPHERDRYHHHPPPPPPPPPRERGRYHHYPPPPPPPPPHERGRYHHHPPPPPPPPPPNEGGRNLHYPPPPPPPLPPPPHERDRYDYPPPPPPPLEMYEFSMQSAVLNGDEYYHRSSSQQQHTSIDSSYQRPTHKPEENLDKSSSSQDKHIYSVSSTAALNDLAIKSSLTKGTNIELNGEYNENIFKPLGKKVTDDYIIEDRSVPTSTKRRETESKKENDYSALIDVRFADDEDSLNMKEVTNNSTYSYRIYMETFSPYLFQATPVIPES